MVDPCGGRQLGDEGLEDALRVGPRNGYESGSLEVDQQLLAINAAQVHQRGEWRWCSGGQRAQIVDVKVGIGDPPPLVVGCDEALGRRWGVLVEEQLDVLVVASNGEDARDVRERSESGCEGAQ